MEQTQLPLYENPPPEERVRGLLCADNKGQVQVVAPEQALVDPDPIRSTTARDLQSLPPSEAEAICAIPGFYGFPSVVHASLKNKPQVALATENPGVYVRATGTQIHQLCSSHVSYDAEFCEDLVDTPASKVDDEQDILAAVDEFTARRIEARLDETLHIPPLPEAARRIIALQQDPHFDLSDLVQIIETDPAIAARILGWANSSFYGSPTPVKTLNDAIMRVLGFDVVFNMALGMSIGATLNLPASHVSGASPYWLDAVYSAATMEALAHQLPAERRPNPGTCYLAGLLSNFGTLVLGHVFPPQYETICRIQEANPQLPHVNVDQHVLSVNREVLAATLMELWELPDEVTTAVRFQHVANYAGEHQTYVKLLTMAKLMLNMGTEIDQLVLEYADEMKMPQEGVETVQDTVQSSREELGDLAHSMAS